MISAEAAPPLSTPITIDTPTKNPTGRGAVFAFNARFKDCLINMKRLIKPSNYKEKIFKPIVIKCGSVRRSVDGLTDMATEIEIIAREVGLILHDKIINELRSATQHYNVGRCIENRYTIKSHETNLVFVKYEMGS